VNDIRNKINSKIDNEQDFESLVTEMMNYAVEDENYEAAAILRDYLNGDDIFKTKT